MQKSVIFMYIPHGKLEVLVNTIVSVEVNISIYLLAPIAIQSLLVQNGQQTHDWTLIGSGANGIGIQVC